MMLFARGQRRVGIERISLQVEFTREVTTMSERTGSILIPLDGTPIPERALGCPPFLARRLGWGILLLRTAEPIANADSRTPEMRSYLDRLAESIQTEGVSCETRVVEGPPSEIILEQAWSTRARYISLIEHRRAGITRWGISTLVDQLIRCANIPVLVQSDTMKPLADERSQPLGPIVIPLDGSTYAGVALSEAVLLAVALNLPITLVHAEEVPPPINDLSFFDPVVFTESNQSIDSYLHEIALGLEARGIRVISETGYGSPGRVISDVVRSEKASFVVMTTHARTGFERVILGSVANSVLHHVEIPVLLTGPAVSKRSYDIPGPLHRQWAA
jgi:nucleotide-binding universal stress UspA family protein